MGLTYQQAQFQMISATNKLVIGKTYFLSSFYERDGAFVRVLSKSTAKNSAGWPSSIEVEVIEPIGGNTTLLHFAPGTKHIVNALNLYRERQDARPRPRFSRTPSYSRQPAGA